jgi:hypothetical protein
MRAGEITARFALVVPRIFAYLCLVSVLGGACVPSDPLTAGELAAQIRPDGVIVLKVVPCEEPVQVSSVRLEGGGGRDDLRWLIEAPSPANQQDFELGVAPPGFTESYPLSEQVSPGEQFLAVVTFANLENPFALEFDLGELSTAQWLLPEDDRLTDTELQELDPCG